MSETPSPAFRRRFRKADVELFAELTNGLVGAQCTDARESTPLAIVLEFGPTISPKTLRENRTRRPRHAWLITNWMCVAELTAPTGEVYSTAVEHQVGLEDELVALVGQRTTLVALSPTDLSLVVRFERGAAVAYRPGKLEPEEPQWFMLLPDRSSLSAISRHSWTFDPTGG
jgi:hypothetical protein